MKNQLYTLLFFLTALGFAPAASAQGLDCGGPMSDVPPADECLAACVYCDFSGPLQGSTLGYVANAAPPGFCSTIQNDQWIGFIARANPTTFTLTPSNCANGNGLEFALYESCSAPPIACQPGQAGGGTTPLSITANNLVVGRHYYLLIDGYVGDTCEYSISVSPMIDPPPMGNISPIQGRAVVCPGANVAYEVPSVTGAGFYTWWSQTPGVLFNGKTSPADFLAPEGRKVQVVFPEGMAGNMQLCVNARNACNQGPTVCRTVSVQPIPPTNLPPIVKCYSDTLIPGIFNQKIILTSWLGCDSIVQQKITVKPPLITNIGNKYLCAGDSIQVCGKAFKDSGPIQVVCPSYQGCDSTVTGVLIVLDPVFQTSPSKPSLNCTNPEVTLTVGPTANGSVAVWRNVQNQIIGTGKTLKVTQAGTYKVTNSMSFGGKTCSNSKEIKVQGNFTQPAPIKVNKSGSLAGGDPFVQLNAHSPTPDLLYQWIGPQGFISIQQNPTVTVSGQYKVTAMHKLSGCTAMATVEVK